MTAARYAATDAATLSPREIELRAFRHVNALLGAARDVPARVAALHKVHRLWSILIDDLALPGNALPPDMKGRLASLGLWAQREAFARLSDEASLEPLLALHRDMIAGLEAQRPAPPAAGFTPASA